VNAPDEFQPLSPSPFAERVGPLYVSVRDSVPIVGVRIEPHHANRAGHGHGGVLMTVADIAMSRAVRDRVPRGATFATADLHIAFLESVGEGAWVEAVPSIDRIGRGLIHGSCLLSSGEDLIARVLATFAVRLP